MPQITFAFDRKSARSIDADGRMRVKDCVLSTAEINPYRGEEIPGYDTLGLKAHTVYELYRDPEELKRAAPTFEGIPLMVKHIPQTAEAPRKEYQCGAVHSIVFDGKHLRGDLLVSDGYAIELIESDELSDLSCGYRYDPVMTSGSKGDQKYDGVMRNIQGNHVALVDDGRATGAHVADAAFRNPQLPDKSMQGDSKMAFPPKEGEHAAAPGAEGPEGAAPAAAAPAAGAAPGAPAAANPQADMASIGQALKHIATLLEALNAKGGGAAPMPAAADTEGADEKPFDEEEEMESERKGAMDFELEPAVKGEHEGALDEGEEQEGEYSTGTPAAQEGTPARGEKTPHGAMDAKTVRGLVESAVKQERARAARVEQAKRDVRGTLGEVYGMDSAPKIYREALKHVGVDTAAVQKGAERAAWQAYTAVAGAVAGVRPRSEFAMDKKTIEASQSAVLGHLAKISVKG